MHEEAKKCSKEEEGTKLKTQDYHYYIFLSVPSFVSSFIFPFFMKYNIIVSTLPSSGRIKERNTFLISIPAE